jgi:hypothetical protein
MQCGTLNAKVGPYHLFSVAFHTGHKSYFVIPKIKGQKTVVVKSQQEGVEMAENLFKKLLSALMAVLLVVLLADSGNAQAPVGSPAIGAGVQVYDKDGKPMISGKDLWGNEIDPNRINIGAYQGLGESKDSTTGSIVGHVYNGSNSTPISGASVSLPIGAPIKSDINGFYSLNNEPVGNINITVSAAGFKSGAGKACVVGGNSTTFNFWLQPTGITPPPPPPPPTKCLYALRLPTTKAFPRAGGQGAVFFDSVILGNCTVAPWTASANQPWIVLTGPVSGIGSGKATYTVKRNQGKNARRGTIVIADQVYEINQAGIR